MTSKKARIKGACFREDAAGGWNEYISRLAGSFSSTESWIQPTHTLVNTQKIGNVVTKREMYRETMARKEDVIKKTIKRPRSVVSCCCERNWWQEPDVTAMWRVGCSGMGYHMLRRVEKPENYGSECTSRNLYRICSAGMSASRAVISSPTKNGCSYVSTYKHKISSTTDRWHTESHTRQAPFQQNSR